MTIQTGHLLLAAWHEFETLRGADAIAQFVASELGISLDDAEARVRELGSEVVAVRLRPQYRLDARPRDAEAPSLRSIRPLSPPPKSAPARPEEATREAPGMLAFRLVTDDGVPIADAPLEVTEGSTTHSVRTDANGLVSLALEEGTYDVRLVEPPLALPSAPASSTATRGDILVERGRTEPFGITARPVGAEPRIVAVRRPAYTEVLVDGYAQGAKVMRWGGMRPRADGTVATTRAALRLALWMGRGRMMCVTGHADPLGLDSDNEALSLARAQSVQLFAAGLLDEWAEHAFANATDLDFGCAMVACNRILGRGPISFDDDQAIDQARAAVRLHAGLATDGPPSAADWRAIADLYDLDLAAILFTDLAGLAAIHSTITWTDAPVVALGERHPRPDSELRDLASGPDLAHRRCGLCIFGSNDTPQAAVDAGGDEVYDGTYARKSVVVPGEVLVDIAVDTPTREPIARGRAWIACGGLGVRDHTAAADGHIRFVTCIGDKIEVLAAVDSRGRGTLIAAGREDP